ncbi:MAG: hypothetical protein RDV48_13115 [Candidatus Eremiobacteraeota bacterium]|nr:hypothetical protein [Candidatus Eremiobacteraeota bacterium]
MDPQLELMLDFVIRICSIAIPATVLCFLFLIYREPLAAKIGGTAAVKVRVPGGGKLSLKGDEACKLVEDALLRLKDDIASLDERAKKTLLSLSTSENITPPVLFPGFRKESEDESLLRELMKKMLVRSLEGILTEECHIELTSLGKMSVRLKW